MKVKTFFVSLGVGITLAGLGANADPSIDKKNFFDTAAKGILAAEDRIGAAFDVLENAASRFLTFKGDDLIQEYSGYGEFDIRIDDGKPEYNLLTLNGIEIGENDRGFIFNQFGVNRFDGRLTLNLGFGYRHLLNNNKVIMGINTFYDHELPYDHNRASLGAEITTSIVSANLNIYQALSGYRPDRDDGEARALDGWDTNVFLALPYLPSTALRFNYFNWNAIDGASDLEGSSLSFNASFGVGLILEAGRVFYESDVSKDDEYFARLGYSVPLGNYKKIHETPFLKVADVPYRLTDVSSKRYLPVKRENRIIKQNKFSVTVSGF